MYYRHLRTSIFATLFLSAPLANAAVLWTSTFTGTDNTARNIVNTPGSGFAAGLTATYSLAFNISAPTPDFKTGTGNTLNNFNPNKNVDDVTGAGWKSTFIYDGGTQSILLSEVTFSIYRFNNSGNVQASDFTVRNVLIGTEYTLDGGTTWAALGTTKTVNLTESGANIPLTFTAAAAFEVDLATDDFRVRYSVTNTGTNVGANTGISNIVFNGTVIPEPAAAITGALGMLTLLRRRRA